MLGLLTLIKPLYARLIKACQTHLYHLEGGSPQEMERSEVGKHRSAPWSRSQRVLPSLCCTLGAGTAGAVGPSASLSYGFILFSRLALDQIQRATEMRNKRLVSSEKDVGMDIVCLLIWNLLLGSCHSLCLTFCVL